MTEAQVGMLFNMAAVISKAQNEEPNTILKSYYLMRCKDITRGYGLPDKHFSAKIRCPSCCIEWTNNTEIKMASIKLSKRQKRRLKSKQITCNKKEYIRSRKDLMFSNELQQICRFCKKSTVTAVLKLHKLLLKPCAEEKNVIPTEPASDINKIKKNKAKLKSKRKTTEMNVYANSTDVFSLQNKSNTLSSTIKKQQKTINNNKKKKDKFAGLCQKAVLASAKLKEKNNEQNKLNLFLKPSSI